MIRDPSGNQPADDAHAEHQRKHLCTACGAEAEIAAVGDDVDLWH
jgi:hypothetical protein